jgi:DNA-binding LacI/PurR family transcriptional regulator
MKQIALRANVSIGTVSRVLNRHHDVDEQMKARVEDTARKLGYRLSDRTRAVVQKKSPIIGLILCNDFGLSSAQSLMLLGIEEYCSSSGYYLLFARHSYSPDIPAKDLAIPSIVQTPGLADCVILSGVVHENLLAALDRCGLKYVLLSNQLLTNNGKNRQRASIEYDDERGCFDAIRYLHQLGHEHIWYIGDAARPWHKNRLNGYVRATKELGLDQHVHTIALSDDEFENGQAAVSYILEQNWPLTAILAASDELAFGAREGLRQHRREVPKDVSLIGFEHGIRQARGSNLTSVSVDMIEIGRQLAKAAIGQIEGRERDGREVVVPALLVKRSTCRPLRKEEQMML